VKRFCEFKARWDREFEQPTIEGFVIALAWFTSALKRLGR
jgi:hypothetical protein